MLPKERVLTAFAHQTPDRVPIDYSANPGIDARLKQHFGLRPDDAEGLRCALGVDFRGVGAPYRGPRLHAELSERRVDPQWGWHLRWIEHFSGGYWDYCDFPLRDADVQTLATWPLPNPDHFDYSGLAEACRRHHQYAVYVGDPGLADIINSTGFLCGMEAALIGLATDEESLLGFIDRRLNVQLEVTRRTLEAARGLVDFLWIGEDLGTQVGPLISADLYRRHLRPRHQTFVDLARSFGLPVMIHSCGSSSWAYDDFIAMGIAAVDTLQPEPVNMAPLYLKRRYGAHLAFHGCISTAGPVAYGTADQVRADCRRTLEVMMPGGGYCFAPTHALQDNSPTENVLAMYQVAHDSGRY